MKKTKFYIIASLAVAGMASCTSNSGTTNSTDSTSQTMMRGDSSVTTTTTVTHHRYSGSFMPRPEVKYIDLRSHKEVTVRIDTERGQVVNSETNEPVDLFVEPTTHDTIYGMTGTVVNNYIIHDPSGDYKIDTVKLNNTPPPATTATADAAADEPATTPAGNYKEKDKNNKSKLKTEDAKIKEKNGIIKEKNR